MNSDFETYFEQITGSFDPQGRSHKPYRWQIDLFEEWCAGKFRPIAIPTGLGKTSVMLVWLLALAHQARNHATAASLPRRLVIVVDRRTVVDQSTVMAEGLLSWLKNNPDHPVTTALASLSSKTHLPVTCPLSISTLRGERADNGDWKRDPACPAIIIGTVYKIGSRLLFWGDGDGRTLRSMHAGLLGQDVLLIHDEAHLSPAFAMLLRQIDDIQRRYPALKPFRCVKLTATPFTTDGDALRLPEADRANPAAAKRLRANKILSFRQLDDEVTPAVKRMAIIDKALGYTAARKTVIIYVVSPDDASSIARDLRKQAKICEVLLLTGTLRGRERDQLTQNPAFQRFIGRQRVDCTTYLVSTSAGEVGIDLDADVAIFDLCMLDSFIQRAGRVNRAGGEGRTAPITLIYSRGDFTKKGHASQVERPRLHKTLELLQQLPRQDDGLDASPDALSRLTMRPEYGDAAAPPPRMRKLEEYLLDTWSMTTMHPRIGPEVAPWLRGISDYEKPQTTLVWRDMPKFNERREEALKQLDEWLSAFPIRTAEKSVIPTESAQKFLEALAMRLSDSETANKILIVNANDELHPVTLSDIVTTSSRPAEINLIEATVILGVRMGGLSEDGAPDPSQIEPVEDVADESRGRDVQDDSRIRERWRLTYSEGRWEATHTRQGSLQLEGKSFDDAASELEKKRKLRTVWVEVLDEDAEEETEIISARIYLVARRPAFPDDRDGGAQAARTQLLDEHLHLVGDSARAIGIALGLEPPLIELLAQAGAAHDQGKNRPWWQQAAGNFADQPLAKCYGRRARWRLLRGYRHEFGSLLDLGDEGVDDDLGLHLVASHHGRARPGFDIRSFDGNHHLAENEQARVDSELRFDRLQRRYGWWGLAYLEALLKCADVMGSKEGEA